MKNAKLLIKSENIDIKKSLYKQALSINDYYTACLYFNELKYMNDPEIFYLQAQLYSKFPSLICCEIDCIIKMLTYEKFEYFNFMYVYDTIMTYAASVNAIDIAKHYVFLLSDRLTGKIKIKLVSEKKNILKTTNFKILDNISQSNLLDEAAMYFVKRNYDKAENILSVVDEDSRESHKSKILQCYLLLAKMKYNDAEILALQILKQYPNDSEVVPILYQLTEKLTDKQKELYNIIIDISNKVSNPIVYMIAGSVYCKLQQFNKALKYVDSDIIKFEDQYKVYYLYMKARCEYNLGNISKAVEYLKYEHCLFPKDFYARHILKKIEGNSTVDDKLFDRSSIIAESHIVFDEIVKLMSESNGEKLTYLDNNDLSFYLHWLNFLNIQQLTNEFINKLICSNYNNKVLLDFLIMTEISESFKKCIIIQLVEKLYMGKFFYMFKLKLKSIKVKYPKSIIADTEDFGGENINEVRIKFLSCYAECVSRLIIAGIDLKGFENIAEKLYKKLYLLSNDDFEKYCDNTFLINYMLTNFTEKVDANCKDLLNNVDEKSFKEFCSLIEDL